jgi:NADH:ubiquinone oxidoreductase subunit 6 (subunit J)
MSGQATLFLIFSGILLLAALRVITARNPVHAVLFLVLAFFSAACLWMLLQAEFLAIVLVLVYVGAVMVLFLFVVMMLDVNIDRLREGLAQLMGRRAGRRADRAADVARAFAAALAGSDAAGSRHRQRQ